MSQTSSPPSSPQSGRLLNSMLAPNDQAVSKFLAKRVGKTNIKLDIPMSDCSAPSSGYTTPKMKPVASVEDCVELCRLLLQKVGADQVSDTAELDRVLATEYPPGVADLLGRITGTLDTTGVLDSVSDITSSSDDEFAPLPSSVPNPVALREEAIPTPIVQKPTPNVEYKAETEIAISRIFQLGKFAAVQDPSIPATAPYDGPKVVTMSGFGELGRFGNQVLQYAFLKAYATLHGIQEIQVPHWVGANLFGLNDALVARAFPSVVEFEGTLANSTFTDELLNYVKKSSAQASTEELSPSVLCENAAGSAPSNVDIWGWFQWHSSAYAPFKKVLRETFAPVPELAAHLGGAFDREIRHRGGRRRTVVGVHLRYGDYQNIAASSFGYCAPTSWYLEWLRELWPTLDNPVLVVTSDDLKSVLGDFAEFDPVTTNSAGMGMPASFKGMKAGFFPDWYALTQCDIVGISNSTFSFSACLMNERPNLQVYRAHYARKMMEIEPWNADPIVHRDLNKGGISHAVETLRILYNTQGAKALLRNVLYELPYYGVRSVVMKAVLWRDARAKLNAVTGSV